MKLEGKKLILTQAEWEKIGKKAGWAGPVKTAEAKEEKTVEAKKKGKAVNPWAVCTKSVGREDKEKYEECVLAVKEKHPVKKD